VKTVTTGIMLDYSFEEVRMGLANIRKCVTVGDDPAIEKLDPLVTVVCLMANHIAAA
jgi:hypothetical protein